jgi:predicted TIM-barrel fold metal-dependent hydrolase
VICAANDWTVGLARRDPNRLSAFVAIDPLRPTALPEIRRWQGDPSVAGIKLHLTSSRVNRQKDSNVAPYAR